MSREKEQKLVDICFSISLTMHKNSDHFRKLNRDDVAKWVTDQLDGCGFKTTPCGASWGILDNKID